MEIFNKEGNLIYMTYLTDNKDNLYISEDKIKVIQKNDSIIYEFFVYLIKYGFCEDLILVRCFGIEDLNNVIELPIMKPQHNTEFYKSLLMIRLEN